MKKTFTQKALSFLLACSLLFSLAVPASADFDATYMDSASVTMWEARVKNIFMVSLDIVAESLGVSADPEDVFWAMTNMVVLEKEGEMSVTELQKLCDRYVTCFDQPMGNTIFGQLIKGTGEFLAVTFAAAFLGEDDLNFEVQKHPSTNLWRIRETTTGLWVVSSAGTYAYARSAVDESGGNKWIGDTTASDQAAAGKVVPETLDRLNTVCNTLKAEGKAVELKPLGSDYKAIWYGRQVYADAAGYPFVAPVVESELAINQERPDTVIKDEDGNIVEGLPKGNITGINLAGMTATLPDGSVVLVDNLFYDESTMTYHFDSHDTYNTNITYHYEWTYYINYTSITYIGTTEEYNKYYEVYYELPDGRDSADLTREELEQLNVGVDVIPYGRSTDNTAVRSLYHFDGDTHDATYWNYCTDFVWNDGVSLTYMDAGVFDGALYLDENTHAFDLVMPSGMGSSDLTLQWRMYQSHTLAPQTDTFIKFGDVEVAWFDGINFDDGEKTILDNYSTGVWNEFALIRNAGTIYYYINGLCVGYWDNLTAFDTIKFSFGDDQQTFKYFDELRVLNYALVEGGASYEAASVPFDTNLALVLPDEAVPVADEFYDFTHTDGHLNFVDFSTGSKPEALTYTTSNVSTQLGTSVARYPNWLYSKAESYMQFSEKFVTFSEGYLATVVASNSEGDYTYILPKTDYIVSVVFADGSVYSHTFQPGSRSETVFDWGTLSISSIGQTSSVLRYYVKIAPTTSIDVVGVEIAPGTESKFSAELVSSVTAMTPDQIETPTLAVRTDLDITRYQIGGVRPSVPEKGMVWALIESQRITSLQIYNGQAWEGVEGRIWTGTDWIPTGSYNVITLQDMHDVADATSDYEYIYTEFGFWDWWQKSWNEFTKELFLLLANSNAETGEAAT